MWDDLICLPKKVKDSVCLHGGDRLDYFILIFDAECQCHANRDVVLEEACLPVTCDCGHSHHQLCYFLRSSHSISGSLDVYLRSDVSSTKHYGAQQ